jgi:mono/diheme cytochrome c family protein
MLVAVVIVGCADAPGPTGVPYLDDRAQRRAELEQILVDPANGYSELRLQNYAHSSGGWDALSEWNPSVAPIAADGSTGSSAPLDVDIDPLDDAALLALGEQAFFTYPVQPVPLGIASDGVWSDATRGLGGLVALDGGTQLFGSCATCHGSVRDGSLVPGLGNEHFDLGHAMVQADAVDASDVAAYLSWGPGRVDVTTHAGSEPVRIPDLRAVRLLTFLQADADVAQLDLEALAIRLETLIITSTGETTRPPRIVALALARYVWSLADQFAPADASSDGAAVFAANCASCHVPPAFTGAPVPLDVVGTDPTIGDSLVRGTGSYRVPSLRGVGRRALLLHDGSLPSLDAMFDPTRLGSDYDGGVRVGAVPGHVFGLDLSDSDRGALLAYLEAL